MTTQITAEQIVERRSGRWSPPMHATSTCCGSASRARGIDAESVIDEVAALLGRGAVVGGGHRRHPLRPLPRSAASRAPPRRRSTTSPHSTRSPARTAPSACTCPGTIPPIPLHCGRTPTQLGIAFDAMNSNTFQDNPSTTGDGAVSYKFGSLANADPDVRKRALEHNRAVIELGVQLGSTALTVWLADGTNHPGQANFRRQFERVAEGLRELHDALPDDWEMYVEHKPYEPAFYSSVNADWGSSLLLAQHAGPRTKCLVDLGHHLPNANIEQVVSRLAMVGRLGGFHFNDSKYGDDDLTVGSIHPYQFFLVVLELVDAGDGAMPPVRYMIDASHNLKDPLEDLIQATDQVQVTLAQALLVDRDALARRAGRQRSRAPPRCCKPRTAATSARSWPRRAAATVLPCRRSPRIGGSATAPRPWRPAAKTPSPADSDRRPMSVPVVAVDFGASSIRVCRVDLGDGPPRVEVVHRTRARAAPRRARRAPVGLGPSSLAELDAGLERATRDRPGRVHRDRHVGRRLRPARRARASSSSRPSRIATRARDSVPRRCVERIGARRLYELTGLQLLAFNTIFQLAAHDPTQLARAAHVVMLPELLVAHLTGEVVAETTSAGTTGLLDLATGDWSDELCDAIGLRRALLPAILPAGHARRLLAGRPRAPRGRPRHRVRGARRSRRGRGRSCPPARGCSSAASSRARTRAPPRTPPGSPTSRVRWVVSACCATSPGWWLVEECRRRGPTTTSTSSSPRPPQSGPRDASSTRPTRASSRRPTWNASCGAAADLAPAASRATVVRTAVESMAAATASVVASLPVADATRPVTGIRVFGGGSRSPLYLDALRRRTDLPVSVGPVEATAIGQRAGPGHRVGCVRGRARSACDTRPTRRRSDDERRRARTARADAPPPRHRRPRPRRRARRRARRQRDDDPA